MDVEPAEKITSPPEPQEASPTTREISPLWPSYELPVLKLRNPEFPWDAVPVKTRIFPETPTLPALAVCIVISPEDVEVP